MDSDISKKEGVYQLIKDDILKGVIKSGEVLKEGELAKQYHVSKTPVREALCILAFENMVQALPRTGYMVKAITVRDVIETLQVRQLLEEEAAALAAQRITEEEIIELEKLLDYSGLVLETGTEWNKRFHLIIAHACGNSRLERVILQIYDEVARISLLDPYLIKSDASNEHILIVKAMRERDSETARACMHAHIEKVRERVLGRFH
jgi:GntR family transcriptional regulator, rspAB operon transcriptional repressor